MCTGCHLHSIHYSFLPTAGLNAAYMTSSYSSIRIVPGCGLPDIYHQVVTVAGPSGQVRDAVLVVRVREVNLLDKQVVANALTGSNEVVQLQQGLLRDCGREGLSLGGNKLGQALGRALVLAI
jgi:hypothetical protein